MDMMYLSATVKAIGQQIAPLFAALKTENTFLNNTDDIKYGFLAVVFQPLAHNCSDAVKIVFYHILPVSLWIMESFQNGIEDVFEHIPINRFKPKGLFNFTNLLYHREKTFSPIGSEPKRRAEIFCTSFSAKIQLVWKALLRYKPFLYDGMQFPVKRRPILLLRKAARRSYRRRFLLRQRSQKVR